MRDYGKVHTSFWSSATTRALSEDARSLALYLLTSPHSTIAGVFRLPDGYVCEDLQWTPERVAEGFGELLSNGYANRCPTTKWVWILKHLEWNPPENPNQRKSAAKIAMMVPGECAWKLAFMRVSWAQLGMECNPLSEPLSNRSATLPQSGTGTGTGTEDITPVACADDDASNRLPKTDAERELQVHLSLVPPVDAQGKAQFSAGFLQFWSTWPAHDRKQAKSKCFESWKKARAERDTALVIAHVEQLKQSDSWRRDHGQYIPAPLAYLNGKKWDGVELTGNLSQNNILAGAI